MNLTTFRHWWLIALKGIVVFVFGTLVMIYPQEATESFIVFYALLMALGGLFVFLFGVVNPKRKVRSWFILEGIIDFSLAMLILFYPAKTATVLAVIFGFWLIISAIFQLMIARRRKQLGVEWRYAFANGLLTLLFGFLILSNPVFGIMTFAFLLGATAIVYGIFLLITSIRWWRLERRIKKI